MFAAQNIVPLFSAEGAHPADEGRVSTPCRPSSTPPTLAKLVAEVAGGKNPDAVAKQWLTSAGLG